MYFLFVWFVDYLPASRPCSDLKLLQTQRELPAFADCVKNIKRNNYGIGFCMISSIIKPRVCVIRPRH